jgi:DNA-binding NarL/FixJ family response regulator
MKPLNVLVAQSDPFCAQVLAAELHSHFKAVTVARSLEELRASIPKHRADVAVVDLELAGFGTVAELRREFPSVTFVCTHRLADEELWTASLAAGAQDCCHPSDLRSIVHAANRTVTMSRTSAA